MVDTESEEARETRKFVLEMLLTDHPNDCMTCEVNGDCELQDLVYDYGVAWPEHSGERHTYEIDPDPNPFIFIDRNKCIFVAAASGPVARFKTAMSGTLPIAVSRPSLSPVPTSSCWTPAAKAVGSVWPIARWARYTTR